MHVSLEINYLTEFITARCRDAAGVAVSESEPTSIASKPINQLSLIRSVQPLAGVCRGWNFLCSFWIPKHGLCVCLCVREGVCVGSTSEST